MIVHMTGSSGRHPTRTAAVSMPLVSQLVEMNGSKYLDGGIADSIPLKAAFDLGFEKNIVVLTRPAGYRKKKFSMLWLAKIISL